MFGHNIHPSWKKGWDIHDDGCNMWKIVRKLMLLNVELKALNSQHFRIKYSSGRRARQHGLDWRMKTHNISTQLLSIE
ncbi:hypothetical protein H5410_064801, partial [Solanum commersonii]